MTTTLRPAGRAAARSVETHPDRGTPGGPRSGTVRRVGREVAHGATELLRALEKHWSTMMLWRL
ncbi:hypothetical protein [Georgenia sp. H159]|uniref:hypothetical protein n=1 Tax=Georgenia sp. H159 TaxID=3076115 RepID=UPI002D789BAE|nr:hypothetical protein [Georgenia sp. H159]